MWTIKQIVAVFVLAPVIALAAETNVAGVHGLLIRTPRREKVVVQIYVAWDLGEYLWDTLMQSGGKGGLEPIGLETWRAVLSQLRSA